jgi:hypothetical protein
LERKYSLKENILLKFWCEGLCVLVSIRSSRFTRESTKARNLCCRKLLLIITVCIDVNSVLGLLCCVDDYVYVSAIHTASIFSVEVCRVVS